MRIDSAEVRAAALLFAKANKETQAAIRKASQQMAPLIKQAAMSHAFDDVSKKIAASGRTKVTTKGISAVFGSTGKHGKAKLSELARPWEFGGNQERYEKYLSRRSGKSMQVTRRTQRQIPPKAPDGRFLYPAMADTAPRIVTGWIRAIAQVVTNG